MGQSVSVVEKPTSRPGFVRYEVNRPLTGTGHERYRSLEDTSGNRPADVVARRLFEHGSVAAVHVHGNQILVELSPFSTTEGLLEVIRGLFTHYVDGVVPRSFG